MVDFRKWSLAFAVVALLLANGSSARASPNDRCKATMRADLCFPEITNVAAISIDIQIVLDEPVQMIQIVVEEEPLQATSLAELSGDHIFLCGIPDDPPGIGPSCMLVRPVIQKPAFINGNMQLTNLSGGNRFALSVRQQWPFVALRI